jgi:glutamine amidotransferase
MAYKGRKTYLDKWLLNSEHSLIEQSKSADMTKYEVNGDGFGVGWYGQKTEPGLFRSIRPAWNNVNLKSLAQHVESPLFLAHVRAATGTPIQETNSHPFKYQHWLMVHNGIIHQFGCLKKELLELIDNQYFVNILGSTDSEVLFYLLMTNGLQTDVKLAVEKTIVQVETIALRHHSKPALRMTLGISNGESLWAIRYSTDRRSSTLFYTLIGEQAQSDILVVSEPLDETSQNWHPVDENAIMHFQPNHQIETEQLKIG